MMEIYCKNNLLLEKAIEYARTLEISAIPSVIHIKRLPPSFTQQGLMEHPRILEKKPYINIFLKLNKERYITLSHEMIHVKQYLKGEEICETEAYLREKTLDNDHQKIL